jgi:hypothetical protein
MVEPLFILGVELEYSGKENIEDVLDSIRTPELLKNYKLFYSNTNDNIYLSYKTWEGYLGKLPQREMNKLIKFLSNANNNMIIDNNIINAIPYILTGLSAVKEAKVGIYIEDHNYFYSVNLNDYPTIKTQQRPLLKNFTLPKRKYPSASYHIKTRKYPSASQNIYSENNDSDENVITPENSSGSSLDDRNADNFSNSESDENILSTNKKYHSINQNRFKHNIYSDSFVARRRPIIFSRK